MNIWGIPTYNRVPLHFFSSPVPPASIENVQMVSYDDYWRETWRLKVELEKQRRQFELDKEVLTAKLTHAEQDYHILKGVHRTLHALNRDLIDENVRLKGH